MLSDSAFRNLLFWGSPEEFADVARSLLVDSLTHLAYAIAATFAGDAKAAALHAKAAAAITPLVLFVKAQGQGYLWPWRRDAMLAARGSVTG